MRTLIVVVAVAAALLSTGSHRGRPEALRTCTIESTHVTVAGQTVTTPTIGYPCP
jgi:hypothetical protein